MRLDLFTNPDQDKCIRAVGLDPDKVPRLRGAGIQKMDEDFIFDYCIVIHTRTGAGNREAYEANKKNIDHVFEGNSNPYMRTSPYYWMDNDDSFDPTYVDFFYRIPEGFDWGESYSPEREKELRDPVKVMEKAINNLKDTMEGEDAQS